MARRSMRQAVKLEQLVCSHVLQMEALMELLREKGLLTERELADRIKDLQLRTPKEPFYGAELLTRLRAVVRSSPATDSDADEVISIGDVELDIGRHRLLKSGAIIHLTPTEFDLLHCLMAHAGERLSHVRLLTAVWGIEYGGRSECLRTFVAHLRKKLEDDPAHPKYLLTELPMGYRFNNTIGRSPNR